MGFPMRFEGLPAQEVSLDNADLKMLAGYFKTPVANVGNERQILNLFADQVRVLSPDDKVTFFASDAEQIGRQDLLQKFKLLKAARVCCWGSGLDKNGEPKELSRVLYFRKLNSLSLYQMELLQNIKHKFVDLVRVRPLLDDELTLRTRTVLRLPAAPIVEGSEYDVVTKSASGV